MSSISWKGNSCKRKQYRENRKRRGRMKIERHRFRKFKNAGDKSQWFGIPSNRVGCRPRSSLTFDKTTISSLVEYLLQFFKEICFPSNFHTTNKQINSKSVRNFEIKIFIKKEKKKSKCSISLRYFANITINFTRKR